MTEPNRDWDKRYREGDTPWDSGIRSRELVRVLDEESIRPCRALELGCGSGTNAVFLAQRGFEVTAVDLSAEALTTARAKAEKTGVTVDFRQADVCDFPWSNEPFDFLFDRGCYHCARKVGLEGYLRTIASVTKAGTLYLSLTGNANDPAEHGPPKLSEKEIREDFRILFEFRFVREIHFEDAGGVEGPLGWSCLMLRKSAD